MSSMPSLCRAKSQVAHHKQARLKHATLPARYFFQAVERQTPYFAKCHFNYHKPYWFLEGFTKLSEALPNPYGEHYLDYADVSYTEKSSTKALEGDDNGTNCSPSAQPDTHPHLFRRNRHSLVSGLFVDQPSNLRTSSEDNISDDHCRLNSAIPHDDGDPDRQSMATACKTRISAF